MRALSVCPASNRAARVTRQQGFSLLSGKNACVRRGQLLTARAAEKTVGPEPPAPADSKPADGGGVEEAPEEPPKGKELLGEDRELDSIAKYAQELRDTGDKTIGGELEICVDLLRQHMEVRAAALKQADEQLRQLKDQYRRLQADFDNFRSRADQEKSRSGAAAKARVLEQLLPVVDNFEIAGKSIKTETEAEAKINDSYQSLYRQTVDIFRNLGLEAVPTVGVAFDPEMHDGVMREENDDVPDGQVLEEFRKGFKYKDELLRPAMVKVAVSSAPPPAAEAVSEGEGKPE